MISGYKTMIRCVTTRMCTTRTCTNTFVHWSFYYHHTLNLIDPCWVIDFNFISSRILPLVIMIRDDDKVRMVWVSSSHYHRPYGSIHVWIIDIVYTCPQLVPWVSKIMMWSLIIAARSFTILSNYGSSARIYSWTHTHGHRSLFCIRWCHIYISRTLQSFIHLLMASRDLCCCGSYHTLAIWVWLYIY